MSDFGVPPPFVNMLDVGVSPTFVNMLDVRGTLKGLSEGRVWVEKMYL